MTDADTIAYYNRNLDSYIERTSHADMQIHRHKFLQYLPPSSKILDAGCGPGRDSLIFQQMGYTILGLDPAEEMVRYVSENLHLPAVQASFQDIEYIEEFDGIWASASLLHVPLDSLSEVFRKLWTALKPGGILFASFKEGIGMGKEGDRTFSYMTSETLRPYLNDFEILDQWIQIPLEGVNLQPCLWLNTLLQKKENNDQTRARSNP